MKIKKINYYSVSRNESGVCSCCGKAIQNICAITTIENEHFMFGSTCFNKLVKDSMQGFQKKKFNHAIKSIKLLNERSKEWETMTEESYREKIGEYEWENNRGFGDNYESETFEDLKEFMLNRFFPYRIQLAEEEIQKYGKLKY